MAERLLRFVQSPRTRRNALLSAIWLAIFGGLWAVREVLLPFVIAVALAYVIDPLVTRASSIKLGGRTIPRWSAVIGIYLALGAILWLLAVFFVPQVYREVAGMAREGSVLVNEFRQPEKLDEVAEKLEDLTQRMRLPVRIILREQQTPPAAGEVPEVVDVITGHMPKPAEPDPLRRPMIDDGLDERPEEARIPIHLGGLARGVLDGSLGVVRQQTTNIVGRLQGLVGGVVAFFFSFFVVLMITAFLQADTDRVKRFFFSIIPVEDRSTFDKFLGQVDHGLSGVVRGQLTICLINGLLTLVGLLILQVKFAFILASVAAVFSLVPIFGSILSTIPIVLVAITSGPWTALLSLLWIIGIHFAEANFLNPKIMGDAAKIHPVVIVLALVAGEHFYGLAGALFAVPFVSFCLTVVRSAQFRAAELEVALHQAHPAPTRGPPKRKHLWRDRVGLRRTLPQGRRSPDGG